MGRMLAREHKVKADIVVPVPEAGVEAGLGFARRAGYLSNTALSETATWVGHLSGLNRMPGALG